METPHPKLNLTNTNPHSPPWIASSNRSLKNRSVSHWGWNFHVCSPVTLPTTNFKLWPPIFITCCFQCPYLLLFLSHKGLSGKMRLCIFWLSASNMQGVCVDTPDRCCSSFKQRQLHSGAVASICSLMPCVQFRDGSTAILCSPFLLQVVLHVLTTWAAIWCHVLCAPLMLPGEYSWKAIKICCPFLLQLSVPKCLG